MPPAPPTDLSAVAKAVQWYSLYSINHFTPEVVLTIGFLLAILLDVLTKRSRTKTASTFFAIAVLAVSGVLSALQWHSFEPGHIKEWQGGTLIFPYSQTLFAPNVTKGVLNSGYGMAVVDNFSVFFKLLVSAAGILVLLMSLASRELQQRGRRLGEYSALILGMSIGLYLMPASLDLTMMYISLELVSIAGYILAGFSLNAKHSAEASLKYILFGALASGLMIYGFSLFYGLTGTTNILAIRQIFTLNPATHTGTNLYVLWAAALLALVGMGYKISAVPFHFWTPDVYEGAPTPVTALLSVASKAAGFGLLLRFLVFTFPPIGTPPAPLIPWQIIMAAGAAITMTVGNLAALLQSNVKRMLAYSSIAHAGYMMAGLAVVGPQGIVSVMIYLATYLFMQLGAFYAIMLIENKIGSEEIDDYRGLMLRTPMVASAFVIFLVSLTGIPLTAGFIGKFYLFTALLRPDATTHSVPLLWLAIAMILNSIVSLYYYLRVAGAMFLKRPLRELSLERADIVARHGTLAYSIPVRLLLFAFIIPVIGLGIYFQPLVDFASGVIRFFNF
jgi:NADH-quinone oxidoreductase subunit N